MKSSRQEKILAIIERESIETQNQLMEALAPSLGSAYRWFHVVTQG